MASRTRQKDLELARLAEELLEALRRAALPKSKDPQHLLAAPFNAGALQSSAIKETARFVKAAAGSPRVAEIAAVSPPLAALSMVTADAARLAIARPELGMIAVLSPEVARMAAASPNLAAIAQASPPLAILAAREILRARGSSRKRRGRK